MSGATDTQTPTDSSTQETQQVTSKIPTTKRAKNPKRVAAGKSVAERTRIAREAQKKAAAEAAVIIETDKAETKPVADPREETRNVLTTTQWLSVISIFVSIIEIYYKREEIKRVFTPQTPPVETPPPQPVDDIPRQRKGIRTNRLNFFLIFDIYAKQCSRTSFLYFFAGWGTNMCKICSC